MVVGVGKPEKEINTPCITRLGTVNRDGLITVDECDKKKKYFVRKIDKSENPFLKQALRPFRRKGVLCPLPLVEQSAN